MSLVIRYVYDDSNVIQPPLTKVVNSVLIIHLSSQHYIDQEEKKLKIAKQSFKDPMIDNQVRAFVKFLNSINTN